MAVENQDPFIRKLLSLPADIKTYIYEGHGSDVCHHVNQTPILRTVPENCIYITLAVCGVSTTLNPLRERAFRSRNIVTKFLKYPYIYSLRDSIANTINVEDEESLSIHFPGDSYVVSELEPFSWWYSDGFQGFSMSGLCEKSRMENLGVHEAIADVRYQHGNYMPIDKERIIQYFRASVYPTEERVRHALADEPAVQQPRNAREGYDICKRISGKIWKEYGYFREGPADSPMKVSMKDGPDAFFSNTYMMEKFPGIHYNIICRSTQEPECTGVSLGRRRANSGNLEQDRIRTLEIPAVQQLLVEKAKRDERNNPESAEFNRLIDDARAGRPLPRFPGARR
jgi:hypothetical protein